MPFNYKKVLVIGATSGIGQALAHRFVKAGSKVIVSGRRQDRLNEFVQQHGGDKASAAPFDISKLDLIPDFVSRLAAANPDLDYVLLNSGTQTVFDFSKPEEVDLSLFQTELTTNYTSFIALTHAFLPFLLHQQHPTTIAFTSSLLSVIPMYRCPGYSATKAAMHSLCLSLRCQLQDSNVQVVEIFPPAVQTELHDYMGPHGRSVGMPLNEFINETWIGLEEGRDEVIVNGGMMPQAADETIKIMRSGFDTLTARLKSH